MDIVSEGARGPQLGQHKPVSRRGKFRYWAGGDPTLTRHILSSPKRSKSLYPSASRSSRVSPGSQVSKPALKWESDVTSCTQARTWPTQCLKPDTSSVTISHGKGSGDFPTPPTPEQLERQPRGGYGHLFPWRCLT